MICPVCEGRGTLSPAPGKAKFQRRWCPECGGAGVIHCCEGEPQEESDG